MWNFRSPTDDLTYIFKDVCFIQRWQLKSPMVSSGIHAQFGPDRRRTEKVVKSSAILKLMGVFDTVLAGHRNKTTHTIVCQDGGSAVTFCEKIVPTYISLRPLLNNLVPWSSPRNGPPGNMLHTISDRKPRAAFHCGYFKWIPVSCYANLIITYRILHTRPEHQILAIMRMAGSQHRDHW